jgi:trans-aconitate 2-methyltransferase
MKKLFYVFLSTFYFLLPLSGTQTDFWIAEEYFENSSSQKNAAMDLMKFVEIPVDAHILDVGCGDGKITAELASKVPLGKVVGVDISPAMVLFAKNNFPNIYFPNLTFSLADAEKLKYSTEFDFVVSFTTLQWVQDHTAFIHGANASLKPSGILAITMPMGLPYTLDQAVHEVISKPEWSSYFEQFISGWNFIEKDPYGELLKQKGFHITRLAVVPQKDIFPTREVFERFIFQWFPYLRPIPPNDKQLFLKQVIDRYLELEPSFPKGEIHFKIRRLEAIAIKEYASNNENL